MYNFVGQTHKLLHMLCAMVIIGIFIAILFVHACETSKKFDEISNSNAQNINEQKYFSLKNGIFLRQNIKWKWITSDNLWKKKRRVAKNANTSKICVVKKKLSKILYIYLSNAHTLVIMIIVIPSVFSPFAAVAIILFYFFSAISFSFWFYCTHQWMYRMKSGSADTVYNAKKDMENMVCK